MIGAGWAIAALLAAAPAVAGGSPASPDYRRIMERWSPNLVAITYGLEARQARAGGEIRRGEDALCGLILTADGLILTSGDPFPDPGGDPETTLTPRHFRVHRPGQRPLEADAVGLDRELNLAWLRLKNPPPGLRGIDFREPLSLAVGDPVVLLGILPENYDYAPILYPMVVNAVIEAPRRMYSVDAPIEDLTIGGLVVRPDGEPVGIVGEDLLKVSPGAERAPGNALALVGSLTQGGKVGYPMLFPHSLFADQIATPPALDSGDRRSWLGIVMQPLGEALIDYWKLDVPGGIIVSSVIEGSPAEKAGLRPADILVEVGGEPLRVNREDQLPEFRRRVERIGPGHPIELAYLREGSRRRVSVTLGDAPRTALSANEVENDSLGLTVREITIDDMQGQNLDPATRGVIVAELEPGGWAQLAGLQPDDIVQAVHGHPVEDLSGFEAALKRLDEEKPEETLFFVLRQTETLFVRVRTLRAQENRARP